MRSQEGVSLVELVLVVMAVAFLTLMISNLPSALSSISRSRHNSQAREIASRGVDNLRQRSFANLANGTESLTDSGLSTLPSSSAVVEIEDCPPEICQNQEKVKKVKVKVNWKESGDEKYVELSTLIGEGGLGQ